MDVISNLKQLVHYAIIHELIEPTDAHWAFNQLRACFTDANGTLLASEACTPDAYTPDASMADTCTLDASMVDTYAPDAVASRDSEHPNTVASNVDDAPAIEDLLDRLTVAATESGCINNTLASKDRFAMQLMGILTPRPSDIVRIISTKKHGVVFSREATDWFYQLCCDAGYVRRKAIKRNKTWVTPTQWGDLEITINLSKPEKDPRDIAAARTQAAQTEKYPACQLCIENEGFSGRLAASPEGEHPARQNLRIIPLEIDGETWGFQYSPYAYFQEHCIGMSKAHRPMHIDEQAFRCLLQFVDTFPHYFFGSNADLPIVGGSILTHDHFQGGNHVFPMMQAAVAKSFVLPHFPEVDAAVMKWPLSVIRLQSSNQTELLAAATHIFECWKNYTDPKRNIYAYDPEKIRHNTITPIMRISPDGRYESYLALRCNLTSEQHPLGIYHPHAQYHHIKKENIGLIEVMGLAILPPRLVEELALVGHLLHESRLKNDSPEVLKEKLLAHTAGPNCEANVAVKAAVNTSANSAIHADWACELYRQHQSDEVLLSEDLTEFLQQEVGIVFSHVLEDAGVFKWDEDGRQGMDCFIEHIQQQ